MSGHARVTTYGVLAAELPDGTGVVSTATGPAPDGGRAGAEPVRQPADGPPGDAGARRGGLVHRVAGRGTYPMTHYDRYLRHLGSIEDPMSLSLDNG
jgi:hypothetical protein